MKNTAKYTIITILTVFMTVSAYARQEISLNNNWEFRITDAPFDSFATIGWQKTNIPHTWNNEDGQNGNGHRLGMKTIHGYYRGPAAYKKNFEIPASAESKRVFIKFQGVSSVAQVCVNGKFVGEHFGAFTAFCFEITDMVKPGQNFLQVKASNAYRDDVPPLSGDFVTFGGIYRGVTLIIADDVCITPTDYASPGFYVTQSNITKEKAQLEIVTKINLKNWAKDFTVETSIKDASGQTVASAESIQSSNAGTKEVRHNITIDNPHLWNGIKDPYLYTATAKVKINGKVTDSVTDTIGLRFYHIDAEKGFFLNGESYQIRGVNRHQDRLDKGWAVSNENHDEDMAIIREIGANGIRLAHYPHADYFYDLCDKNGLVVWAEIPLVDTIVNTEKFHANAKQYLTELIRQNYNHPSIVMWSLFNEIFNGHTEQPDDLIAKLNILAHNEDKTRFTVAAANHIGDYAKTINLTPDYIAFNSYPGWYGGGAGETMGRIINDWNNMAGKKGIAIAEYGAGGSINHHEQNPKQPKTAGQWHPEEWQALVHENCYNTIAKADCVWGSYIWNMFDFASIWRIEGDTMGRNDKGMVTYDRKNRKDAFFFYRANWNTEISTLHITSKRHTERTDAVTPVKIYSNSGTPTLTINGKDMGTPQDKGNHVYLWPEITLKNGTNNIETTGIFKGLKVKDSCQWTLK